MKNVLQWLEESEIKYSDKTVYSSDESSISFSELKIKSQNHAKYNLNNILHFLLVSKYIDIVPMDVQRTELWFKLEKRWFLALSSIPISGGDFWNL